jgi:predicted dehydrogenase
MPTIGLLGAGYMARMHAECFRWIPEARLVGVTGGSPVRAQAFAAKYDCEFYPNLEALLSEGNPDIIDICTPTYLHHTQTLAAAAAGKHILCEKPMALTPEEAEEMISACRKAKVKFMVAHVLRFWPEYRVIHELVATGKLGGPLWATARRFTASPDWSASRWHQDPKRSGGGALDLHIHDLDFLAWTLGKPKQISSRGSFGPGGGIDTIFSTCSGHANTNAVSQAAGSNNLPAGFAFQSSLVMALEKGAIAFDTGRQPTLLIYEAGREPYTPTLPKPPAPTEVDVGGDITDLGGYYFEVRYFIDCILQNKEPEIVTPEDAKFALQLSLAARESAGRGRIMEIG